jgi:hypothetical protein
MNNAWWHTSGKDLDISADKCPLLRQALGKANAACNKGARLIFGMTGTPFVVRN